VAWAVATTLTMFDTALTFCALLGLLGLARASRADGRRGWPMLALATGLGLLAKGPVVLLFIVPVAVAAPWWGRPPRSWRRWYAAVVGALGAGASVALAWAVPAAQRGGAAYGAALLWTQTVDRLAASFAHHRPVWWYVAVLPVLLLPWSAWPALWRAAAAQVGRCAEPGLRFVVVWFAAAFAGLSLVSGKQVHYLLPALPAVGLLAARTVLGRPGADPVRRLRALALASVALVAVANVIAQPVTGDAWDVTSLAARIHTWQEEGRPVAHVGKYHGQFHFPGRLTRPLQVIDEGTEQQWLRRHPGGRIVVYQPRGVPLPSGAQFVHPYRVKTAVVLGNAERRGGPGQPRPDDSDS
jgi:4-amino-4-deoxy-L-arabinose transferase-like glycosyltransferase